MARSCNDAMNTADDFTAKWQARWPEWGIGAVFLPGSRRETAFAWFALLQELTEAAWGGADATPGLAKLALPSVVALRVSPGRGRSPGMAGRRDGRKPARPARPRCVAPAGAPHGRERLADNASRPWRAPTMTR
jgi:hypothetical protein